MKGEDSESSTLTIVDTELVSSGAFLIVGRTAPTYWYDTIACIWRGPISQMQIWGTLQEKIHRVLRRWIRGPNQDEVDPDPGGRGPEGPCSHQPGTITQ